MMIGDYMFVERSERDALIQKHIHLVQPIAERVKEHLPPSFDLEDLISEGYIGLITAAARYRPRSHGRTPFSAFARMRIRGAIIDSVRRRAWLENTANPLEDAAEPVHERTLPFLVRGPHDPMPRRRGLGAPTAFRPDHLPPRLRRGLLELTARQRVILGSLYGPGEYTITEIAEDLLLTVEQITSEHAAALESLRKILLRNLSPDGLDPTFFEPSEHAA